MADQLIQDQTDKIIIDYVRFKLLDEGLGGDRLLVLQPTFALCDTNHPTETMLSLREFGRELEESYKIDAAPGHQSGAPGMSDSQSPVPIQGGVRTLASPSDTRRALFARDHRSVSPAALPSSTSPGGRSVGSPGSLANMPASPANPWPQKLSSSPGSPRTPGHMTGSPSSPYNPQHTAGSPFEQRTPQRSFASPGSPRTPGHMTGSPGSPYNPQHTAGSPFEQRTPERSFASSGSPRTPGHMTGSPGSPYNPQHTAGLPFEQRTPERSFASPGSPHTPGQPAGAHHSSAIHPKRSYDSDSDSGRQLTPQKQFRGLPDTPENQSRFDDVPNAPQKTAYRSEAHTSHNPPRYQFSPQNVDSESVGRKSRNPQDDVSINSMSSSSSCDSGANPSHGLFATEIQMDADSLQRNPRGRTYDPREFAASQNPTSGVSSPLSALNHPYHITPIPPRTAVQIAIGRFNLANSVARFKLMAKEVDFLDEYIEAMDSIFFDDTINWGRISTGIIYTGMLAVKTSRANLNKRVYALIRWCSEYYQVRLLNQWIEDNHGWPNKLSFATYQSDD